MAPPGVVGAATPAALRKVALGHSGANPDLVDKDAVNGELTQQKVKEREQHIDKRARQRDESIKIGLQYCAWDPVSFKQVKLDKKTFEHREHLYDLACSGPYVVSCLRLKADGEAGAPAVLGVMESAKYIAWYKEHVLGSGGHGKELPSPFEAAKKCGTTWFFTRLSSAHRAYDRPDKPTGPLRSARERVDKRKNNPGGNPKKSKKQKRPSQPHAHEAASDSDASNSTSNSSPHGEALPLHPRNVFFSVAQDVEVDAPLSASSTPLVSPTGGAIAVGDVLDATVALTGGQWRAMNQEMPPLTPEVDALVDAQAQGMAGVYNRQEAGQNMRRVVTRAEEDNRNTLGMFPQGNGSVADMLALLLKGVNEGSRRGHG